MNPIIKRSIYTIVVTGLVCMTGCKKSWLEPTPLSFFTPENAYTDAAGLRAGLVACARNARIEYYGDNPPILTEMLFSEVTVDGVTDKSGPAQDLNLVITPDNDNFDDADHSKIGYYWREGYRGIKYANSVITYIDNGKFASEAEKNAVLGSAYFHRALRFYRLTNQFGDIPVPLKEYNYPKLDFQTVKREVVLQRIKEDLDFAAKWVTDNVNRGEVTKGAVLHLLTKVNLALGKFDDAITSSTALINGGTYSLMKNPFGATKKNVIWDLHRPENKSLGENKEGLFMIIDRFGDGQFDGGIKIMRQAVPYWGTYITTPIGRKGTADGVAANVEYVQSNFIGRGIGRCRPTPYSEYDIWDDANDLRHAKGNWMTMEEMVYNDPDLKKAPADTSYMKNLRLRHPVSGALLCSDTIRSWFNWPQYKLFIPDNENSPMQGGHTDWYMFRLAETYLLRAEAYFWKNDPANAMKDINEVRTRAQCAPYTDASKITMATILDERARELFFEEPRKTELTRISFLFAKTGKVAENGKTYTLDKFSDDNYFYDRVMAKNTFYKNGVVTNHGDKYTMSAYHVLWPVPSSAIQANSSSRLNQNKGYVGFAGNVPALDSIPSK